MFNSISLLSGKCRKKKIRHLPTSLSPANTLKNLDSFSKGLGGSTMTKGKKRQDRRRPPSAPDFLPV